MRPTFVLNRGEYDKGDKNRPVTRELPKVFGPLPEGLPKNRLGLARWLVSDDNPLLKRVAINRYWEFVFGTGIVRTSEDFGMQGEWPSHPELLDWFGRRVRPSRPQRTRHAALDGHQRDVPPAEPGRPCRHQRSGQPPAVVVPATAPDGRGDPRPGPLRERAAGRANRRAERQAVPARRAVARSGDAAVQHADLPPRQRRRAVATQPIHLLEARLPAAEPADVRRADARVLHDPAIDHQHAAAGPGAVERRTVRRGRRANWRADRCARRPPSKSSSKTCIGAPPAGSCVETSCRWPRRPCDNCSAATGRTPRERPACWPSATSPSMPNSMRPGLRLSPCSRAPSSISTATLYID